MSQQDRKGRGTFTYQQMTWAAQIACLLISHSLTSQRSKWEQFKWGFGLFIQDKFNNNFSILLKMLQTFFFFSKNLRNVARIRKDLYWKPLLWMSCNCITHKNNSCRKLYVFTFLLLNQVANIWCLFISIRKMQYGSLLI